MQNFARALQQAWRHWPALSLGLLCSLGVAALWGANIAAIFPIIETTLHGESLQTWNAKRLTNAQANLAQLETQTKELQAQHAAEADAKAKQELAFQIEMQQGKLQIEKARIYSAERLQPFFDHFLPVTPFGTVVFIVVLVGAATALKQFLMLTNTILVTFVSQSIALDVRRRIFNKAISLDRPTFDVHGISGFTAHITHTTDMLSSGITNFYGGAVTEPLRIIACLAGAWMISWRLTLASLIFAPLAAFLILFLNRRIRGLSLRILDRSMSFHHVMLEVFNSILTVQANTMEDFERSRFADATRQIRRYAMKATFYHGLSSPITELLGMGMLCTGVAVSSYLVINQETHILGIRMTEEPISITLVTVFFAMLIGAADPLRKLSSVITGVNAGMAAADMLYPMLEMKHYLQEPSDPKPLPAPLEAIEFRDVYFTYDGVQKIFEKVNLTINRGDRLAVIGPNGGGKSTIINLVCRFYDPYDGQVLFNGVSLQDVAIRDVRSRIALVTQQTELFNETIAHNIRYGRWDATDDEIKAAAKLARADGFISSFPNGYDTKVGPNGHRLSGGQRQRIALARAILRNAEVLILDEATSQIDVESEKLIHEALAEYAIGRTLIMVTHRESTLALATRIIRVDHGHIEQILPASKAA